MTLGLFLKYSDIKFNPRNQKVDFQEDVNYRGRFIWQVSEDISADLGLVTRGDVITLVYWPGCNPCFTGSEL